MRWIKIERHDGVSEWINADQVQRIRVFEDVTRLVFRAMPGGFDELAVKISPDEVMLLLARPDKTNPKPALSKKGRTKAGATPPNSPQKP